MAQYWQQVHRSKIYSLDRFSEQTDFRGDGDAKRETCKAYIDRAG